MTRRGLLIASLVGFSLALALLLASSVGVALVLPMIQQAREEARREAAVKNLRQIALAIENYHERTDALPGPLEDQTPSKRQ